MLSRVRPRGSFAAPNQSQERAVLCAYAGFSGTRPAVSTDTMRPAWQQPCSSMEQQQHQQQRRPQVSKAVTSSWPVLHAVSGAQQTHLLGSSHVHSCFSRPSHSACWVPNTNSSCAGRRCVNQPLSPPSGHHRDEPAPRGGGSSSHYPPPPPDAAGRSSSGSYGRQQLPQQQTSNPDSGGLSGRKRNRWVECWDVV